MSELDRMRERAARVDAVEAVVATADAVTDWYDRNDAAKANRRDFPTTDELKKLNGQLREAVRRWRMYQEISDNG